MEHLVDFEKYCRTCIHKDKGEAQYPCDDCLEVAAREDSRKPLHYSEKRGEKNGET